MHEYVEKALRTEISRQQIGIDAPIPLHLRGSYDLEQWGAFGVEFVVAKPKSNPAAKTLAAHEAKLRAATGLPVAFAYEETTGYRAARLAEEGLPFIVDGRQVYLPFLGVALTRERTRKPTRRPAGAEKVSAQTQRLILKAIYEDLPAISVTDAAALLGVAKITASRIYDELEAVNPAWISISGRARMFNPGRDRGPFLAKAEPHLFNPVVREYRLERVPEIGSLPLSGISAISRHSMLADNAFPTFAITKAQEQELGLKAGRGLADWDQWDEPACVLQVMRYRLDSMDGDAIDPVSAILSLPEEDDIDPRVEEAIEHILKRVLER